jgi:Zn-dependent protease with chaperone function
MLDAFFYDGQSAKRHAVRLAIDGDALKIEGAGIALRFALREVKFGEALKNAPRDIRLPGGGLCEVSAQAELAGLLAAAGISESVVVRVQKRWRWTLASLLLIVAASVSLYRWGLPEAARILAERIPPQLAQKISSDVLVQLDRDFFTPSRLPAERQEQIRQNALALLGDLKSPPWQLNFRSSRRLGSNAFALPDGNIVVLDQLAQQLDNQEINAVLAHELGHLVHRDALRQLIQKATVAFVLAAWFGDVSSAAVGIGSALLQTDYSREAESAADEKLERFPGKSAGLLATHPDTRQRIAAIRAVQR